MKPLYDHLIFKLLATDFENIEATHSCNIKKPWCRRCPKCLYVLMSYMAYFPKEVWGGIVEDDIFVEDNRESLERLVGLRDHKPFECIGTIEESVYALISCYEKGEGGELVKEIYEKVKNSLSVTDKEKLTSVFKSPNVPEDLRGGLYDAYDSLSEESQKDALWGKILK